MNNKMKIKIQKRKKKKTWRRRRTRARDGTWRGMGVRGNDGSRNNSSRTAATRRKKKKHGPLSFARPSSRCLPKIFSFTSLFFSFHRLLLAHRGKRNGFCHYIDIMTIYTSIRKWWRYSYLSTYGPALFCLFLVFIFIYLSLWPRVYTLRLAVPSLSLSLSPFRYLRNG